MTRRSWNTDSPYFVEGPALISFSGGRTSAYMLHEILRAYDGQLPGDVVVAFANTGKEREETLRFVHECAVRWGVTVRWVEWRNNTEGFEEVGINSCSRAGEPFDALIDHKQRLPNGQERWCTEFLKVKAMQALMRALGFGRQGRYLEPIGLRADEEHRILPGLVRADLDGRRIRYPLAKAGVTKRDIRLFWWGSPDARYETSVRPQGFDLELPDLWGNCDLCFAMGAAVREERVRQRPEVATWWAAAERRWNGTFSKREAVADLRRRAAQHEANGDLLDLLDDNTECGTWCSGDAA